MADGAEACPTCGMEATVEAPLQPVTAATAPTVFEPGPSFNEPPAATANGAELPSWLQSFGGSVEAAPEPTAPPSVERTPPDAEQASTELPHWLAAPRADEASDAAPAWSTPDVTFGDGDDNGFISEDDLPDWLRSIGGDSAPAEAPNAVSHVNGMSTAATREMRIPTVVSAWVVGRETIAAAPGESLFAHIASEEQLETAAPERPDAEQTLPSALPEALAAAPAEAPNSAPHVQASARSRRMLLYVGIAMLLLLVLIMVVQR